MAAARPGRPLHPRALVDLVARPGLGRRPRRLHRRPLALGGRRGRAEPALRGRACARLEHRHLAGDQPAAAAVPPGLLGLRRRPLRERGPAGPGRRARARRGARSPDARPEGYLGDADRLGLRPSDVRPFPDGRARRLGAGRREAPALGVDEHPGRDRDRGHPVRGRRGRRAPAPSPLARRARPGQFAARPGAARARDHAAAASRRGRRPRSSSRGGSASCSPSGRRCTPSASICRSSQRASSCC